MASIPGLNFVDEQTNKKLTKSQKKKLSKKKNKQSQDSQEACPEDSPTAQDTSKSISTQDNRSEKESKPVTTESSRVLHQGTDQKSTEYQNNSTTVINHAQSEQVTNTKPIFENNSTKSNAIETEQITEDLSQLHTDEATNFQKPYTQASHNFESPAPHQPQSSRSPPAHQGIPPQSEMHNNARNRGNFGEGPRGRKHQGPPDGVPADRNRSRSHEGRDDRQRQGHGKGKGGRKTRFDEDSKESHGKGGSMRQDSREQQSQHQQNAVKDPTREMADRMKDILQNPRAASLEVYEGAVYAEALAGTLQIPFQQLHMIAKMYDGEFEIWNDPSGSANIRMKRHRRRDDDPDTVLSKKLSGLLRHRAEDKGFKLLDGGFLFVEDILKRGEFKSFSADDVRRIVKNNDKQRFKLEEDEKTKKLKIRANQGHSMKIDNLELHSIKGKDVSCCVHGTSYDAWQYIKSSGLKTMGRNHIHFAPGEPGESGVISGMRSSCQVLVFVNMDKAIADGIEFGMSANKVILSEGDKYNTIQPKYFEKVIDRKSRKHLPYAQVDRSESKDESGQEKGKGGKGQAKGKKGDQDQDQAGTSDTKPAKK